jgi:antitoxin component YwqK of YwqJK toxin-antitoxin module
MKKIILLLLFSLFGCFLWSQNIVVKVTNENKEQLSFDENHNLHGKCYVWNPEGVLIAMATYKHGAKHGVWKIFYDDGTIAYKMYYTNGNKTGTWVMYSKDGTVLKEQTFS